MQDNTAQLISYWRQAAPHGSSLYYSLLFAPNKQREVFNTLYALHHCLRQIPLEVSDPGIARTKLFWWQDECTKMLESKAIHPLTQALQTKEDKYDFQPLINHNLRKLDQLYLDNDTAILAFCRDEYIGLQTLLIPQAKNDEKNYQQLISQASIVCGIFYLLVNLRPLSLQQVTWLHPDCLQADKLAELFITAYEDYQQTYRQASKALRQKVKQLNILIGLSWRRFQEIKRDGLKLLEHDVHLTPIRKLLTAWRLSWT